MELWIKAPDGRIVGVYRDGKLVMHMPVGTDGSRMIAFELFNLLVQLMNVGAAGIGSLVEGQGVSGDSDFGTAAEPGE